MEHLIEVQNPNRMAGKQNKKISELSEEGTAQLSRRERCVSGRNRLQNCLLFGWLFSV